MSIYKTGFIKYSIHSSSLMFLLTACVHCIVTCELMINSYADWNVDRIKVKGVNW